MPTSCALKGLRSLVSVSSATGVAGSVKAISRCTRASSATSLLINCGFSSGLQEPSASRWLSAGVCCPAGGVSRWLVDPESWVVVLSSRWAFAARPPLEKVATKPGT